MFAFQDEPETYEQYLDVSDSASICRDQSADENISHNNDSIEHDEADQNSPKVEKTDQFKEDVQSTITDMEFEIPLEQWRNIRPVVLNGRYILPESWRSYLLDKVASVCNCVISFGYSRVSRPASRKRNFPLIRQNATCTFPNCRTFRFVVAKDQNEASGVRLKVTVTGEENHTSAQSRFRRTTASEFLDISEKLTHKDPEEVYEDLISEADPVKLLHGNFNVPKSPAVIRRIRSVINQQERLHRDVSVELQLMQRLYAECDTESKQIKGYVQHTGANPFFVILYSEEQLRLICNDPVIVHFDATGSIFRTIQGVRTRMLLYSLILPNPVRGEPPVSIAEMVASRHNTEIVSHMLLCMRLDINRLCRRQATSGFSDCLVVTDFSWVLIHSVLHELNDALDINSYLTRTYLSLVKGTEWKPCTGVFLCVNHMVHIVARKTTKLVHGDKKIRDAFMHCFVLLQYSGNFKRAIATAANVIRLFGLQHKTPTLRSAKAELADNLTKWNVMQQFDTITNERSNFESVAAAEDEEVKSKSGSGIRADSPWTVHFKNIFKEITEENNNKSDAQSSNRYYSPALIKYLLSHLLPIFPLWCTAVKHLFKVKFGKAWYSNANVEQWFSYVKQRHLRRTGTGVRVRITNFIYAQRKTC